MSRPKMDLTGSRIQPALSSSDLAGLLGCGTPDVIVQATIVQLPVDKLQAYARHTYKVADNSEMQELAQSIRENGVITPLYVRQMGDMYEIISGHRRAHAAQLVGLTELPCIVDMLDDDTAALRMVETNRYRETILPSERALSYKLAADTLRRQGRRSDLYGTELTHTITEVTGESERSVRNWIRLTALIPPLLEMVDAGRLPVRSGVELSYLLEHHQKAVQQYLDTTGHKLSVLQAEQIRRQQLCGVNITIQKLHQMFDNTEADTRHSIKFKKAELERISNYIPSDYRTNNTTDYIIQALQHYNNNVTNAG